MKQLLTTAPVLRVFDPTKEFKVYTYACKEGVRADLSQEGKVVVYESRKLKEYEQ